jgi:hypothetical protein
VAWNAWLWESGKNWLGLVNFVAAASAELAAKEARTRGADQGDE